MNTIDTFNELAHLRARIAWPSGKTSQPGDPLYQEHVDILKKLSYVNIQDNWTAIKKAMDSKTSRRILNAAMADLVEQHYPKFEMPKNGLQPYKYPQRGDALCEMGYEKPELRKYYRYCSGGSCHWSVYFHLHVCQEIFPTEKWVIVKGEKHSTVYSWKSEILFEMFYYFIDVSPQEAWLQATNTPEDSPLWNVKPEVAE